jgi:hypothetical protein
MAEPNPFMAMLAQKMGGKPTPEAQPESNQQTDKKVDKRPKRASSRDKVKGMRNYTAGRSVSDFIASQSESPFLRSAYAYAKTIRQRREMEAAKKDAAVKGKAPVDDKEKQEEGEEGTADKRTGIRTIATLKRQLKTVEKVTIENQKDTKQVVKAISEIKKGILGIKNAIKKITGSFSNITSSITPSPEKSLAASAARMYSSAGADTKELMKPIDVKSEGQEYLYYRGAPEGRQFYKKGRSGAAGAIASRETSEKLFAELDKKLSAISAKMNGGEGDAGKVAGPKDYGQLKEVDNREETEKLEKALEGALRKVLPTALAEAGVGDQMPMMGGGGGGLLDGLGGFAMRAAGGLVKGAAALGRAAFKGVKNIGAKVGGMFKRTPTVAAPTTTPTMPTGAATSTPAPPVEAAKKAAEQTAGATAQKAAEKGGTAAAETAAKTGAKTATKTAGKTVLKSALKKIPIIGALAGLGFGAQRALSGDLTGAGLEVASGLAGTLPGLGTAASIGIDAGLAARDMGMLGKSAMPNPVRTDIPGTIMERTSANMQAARQTAPPVIVNAPSTPPAVPPPAPQPKPFSATPTVRNPDDAFMRATYKDFYHPSSLYK